MKHYFLVAKEVGELTRIVCSALEMKQLKSLPSLGTLLSPFGWQRRAASARTSDFRIENGRISAVRQGRLRQGPGELHPPVRPCRRAAGHLLARGVASGARRLLRLIDDSSARQSDGQPAVPRG